MSCHGQIATFVSKRRDGRDAARIPAANFPLVHASPNSALIALGGAVSCVGELLGETLGVR